MQSSAYSGALAPALKHSLDFITGLHNFAANRSLQQPTSAWLPVVTSPVCFAYIHTLLVKSGQKKNIF